MDEAIKESPEIFQNSKIYLTDGLDEKKIYALRKRSINETGKDFPADVYGVGTELGNPGPLRGGVYKISAHSKEVIGVTEFAVEQNTHGELDHKYLDATHKYQTTMKLAGRNPSNPNLPSSKSSYPGVDLDILRLKDEQGKIIADVIVDTKLDANWKDTLTPGKVISAETFKDMELPAFASAELLLKRVFERTAEGSRNVYDEHVKIPTKPAYADPEQNIRGPEVPDLAHIQHYCKEQVASLPDSLRNIENPGKGSVYISPQILKEIQAIMEKDHLPSPEVSGVLKATDAKRSVEL